MDFRFFPGCALWRLRRPITFYDKLQELSAVYFLPLMPFNALRLEFNFEGLFVPGLGTERYADCASTLMEVLLRLLPITYTDVQAKLLSVHVNPRMVTTSFGISSS